jgi:hypothetical protein
VYHGNVQWNPSQIFVKGSPTEELINTTANSIGFSGGKYEIN